MEAVVMIAVAVGVGYFVYKFVWPRLAEMFNK